MRKTLLTASLLLLSVTFTFGQKALVDQAWSLAKRTEKPDFKQARASIQQALAGESAEDAKAWYVAGNIEQRFFEKEYSQLQYGLGANEDAMYKALYDGYKYYLKAVELDTLPNEKGKVKPKYLKNIQKDLLNNTDGYNNGAVHQFNNKKDYKGAYDYWNIILEIRDLPFMAPMAKKMPSDSIYAQIEYNASLAAYYSDDRALSVKAHERAKGNGYEQNSVYQRLVQEYSIARDTVNLIATLNEGNQLFGDTDVERKHADGSTYYKKEDFYGISLMNLYISSQQYDKAFEVLNEILPKSPENYDLWNVKGNLHENQGETEEAIKCFQKALELNPKFADALGSMGRIYFNQAVEKDNELSTSITNTAEYNKAKEQEVLPLYRQALPYFEQAHQLNADERDYMVALRSIYYNLNDAANLKLIEIEMGL
ncbi:MAG: tetratricopeptide repeat protein [Bacteroidaceae bacterium]|nr:tetratricopeptide repeat protein [Bacteroidaceae bacterium]